MIEAGNVIELKDKDRLLCGAVLTSGDKQLHVLTSEGKEAKIPREKILHAAPGIDGAKGKSAIVDLLRAVNERRDSLKNSIQLRLLWEIAGENDQVRTAEELANLYFGESADADQVAAMIRILHQDWGYFRPRGNGYFTVDAKTVRVMEEGRRQQAEHRKREDEFVSWLARGGSEELPPGAEPFVEIIKEWLIDREQSAKSRQAHDLLKRGKVADDDALFAILMRCGVFRENENLLLKRYRVPGSFPKRLEDEAAAASNQAIFFDGRLDLSGVPAFTIDDETTTDIDDALSLEIGADGWRVGIHIADVAELVPKDSPLDKEALARSTSIYLPDQKISMFPDSLTDAASLNRGKIRPAISVLASFHKNGQMTSWEIRETLIRVNERLSYDEVDDRMAGDAALEKLHRLAVQFQEDRKKSGAMIIHFPKAEISASADGKEISVRNARPRTPSQILVSEWMIFANRLVAGLCSQSRIPVLYRTQQPPGKVFPISDGDWVSLFRQRRYMRKGEVTVHPSPHHGLGLPVYLQMTSPIRRFSDLVIHRQLKAHLRKEQLPYGEDDLEAIRAYGERWVEIADMVEKEWRKYWLLKFLAGKMGSRFDAVVLEATLNEYLLFIPEYSLEVPCPRGLKNYAEGDSLQVTLELAKPREGVIKVIPL